MAGGGGGGDGDVSRAQQPCRGERRGHRQKEACLPLDVIAEIAARSDPATLVRCAATCRDARRRIAEDPSLLGRLRLRDTERFVLPLLRGHLAGTTTYTGGEKTDVYMVDTTAADATRLVNVTRLVKATFAEADQTLSNVVSMDSRGGLVLVLVRANYQRQLLVCNLATRRCLALPPEPVFPYANWSTDWSTCGVQYVLLVGGSNDDGAGDGAAAAAVGRPFHVLKSMLVLSQYRSYRCLLVHTFSSEDGAWSPLTEIPTPNLQGSRGNLYQRPLVVGDVVHWLCLTNGGSYMLMLMLHVRAAARVNVTALPASFPRDGKTKRQYLLATATAGGNPVVLVADADRISAWEQSKHTKMWKPRPQVVIENETILGFHCDALAELLEKERRSRKRKHVPELLCFGERSGAVLLKIDDIYHCSYCLLWLDLQSKKIVRCFSPDRRMQVYCAYEVDLSSWVPTFSNAVTL